MSWKSLVSAGLLCVVASPVFAVPTLNVSSGGLDASGNWIWNVTITPTAAGTPLAGELGFRETVTGSQLQGATKGAKFTGTNTDNPGKKIFTWETISDTDGDGTVETNGDDEPVGLQTNAATDEVFAALGTIDDLPAGGATQYVTITTAGPTSARLTTQMQVLGGYGTGGTNGRIAEITGTAALNYSNFAGTASRTVLLGDTNLSGSVSGADLADLAANFGKAGNFGWAQGDLNGSTGGTGEVSGADLADLASKFGQSGGTNTPLTVAGVAGGGGASLGGGSAVPEPASVALAALALLGGLGLVRRRQK